MSQPNLDDGAASSKDEPASATPFKVGSHRRQAIAGSIAGGVSGAVLGAAFGGLPGAVVIGTFGSLVGGLTSDAAVD